MDYEKKYNEALETARKINSGEGVAAPSGWTKLEVIFPELRESEDETKSAIDLISEERERQISKGFNWKHDDEHDCHQLSDAAIVYAAPAPLRYQVMNWWPWDKKWLKEDDSFTTEGRIRELVKAGALIVAEIERLQRTVNNISKPIESEDERIRKEAISIVKQYGRICEKEGAPCHSLTDVLAYLEKQKKPHIPWYDYQKSKEAGYTIVPNKEYEQLIKQKEQKPVEKQGQISREDILHQLVQNGSITMFDYLYLTKEQKPVWSEEDEKRIKQLIYDTEAIRAGYEKRKEKLGDEFNNELIRDCDTQISWLKSLPERFNLQPKQEWSEEDERLGNLIAMCIACGKEKGLITDDDNTACLDLLFKIYSAYPQWKPSEEQMAALKSFLDYHRPTRNGSVQNWQEFDNLESLYNDLKKL